MVWRNFVQNFFRYIWVNLTFLTFSKNGELLFKKDNFVNTPRRVWGWASCKHFHCQNQPFRVLEAGYWKVFQNKKVISKEQAKALSWIFSFK
jgi:hypothetical protein